MRRTKPIRDVAFRAERSQFGNGRVASGGRNAQNEPNFAGRAGSRTAKCAKRTQFHPSAGALGSEMRKTKPIWEEVPSLKCQVLSRASRASSPQRPPASNYALQTSHCGGAAGPIVQNEPNFRRSPQFELSSVKRNVQNEPNSRRCRVGRGHRSEGRGQTCETKPISEEVSRGEPTHGSSCRWSWGVL